MSVPTARRIQQFVQRNRPHWEETKKLINSVDGKKGERSTLDQLGRSYRQTAAHLAYARTYFPDHPIVQELNSLVLQAHKRIYGHVSQKNARQVLRFFLNDFPSLFHERAHFFLFAMGTFLVGAIFAFITVMMDPSQADAVLPPGMVDQIQPGQIGQNQWDSALVSGELMVNNIRVAFFCFALGALFGVGTLWALFTNGLLIGALAALYHRIGESYSFWAFIWPHGLIELTAIFIAGAAGLSLARSWLIPGDYTRVTSFKQEGKVTILMVIGVIPMFVIAALIEAFITPAPWPIWSKYLVAIITLISLFLYFGSPFFKGVIRRS
ncbi:Uncharacterized membrane protein SpoIIM, required for sporulation [Marininema mesophilum]|uniref:Uncharacterized membrane protein SpoIIM, required for sporulation n=1 Tax=Marininema mesophilum TaxID=1048340 RepID=A0A1H2ZMS3_9BACL|nr:stage II sporulation protein M [Marininema mesophilum]SDX18707.1 Uncharacterized membrane protein SpoIIM, required for sporulation [Marininema mesophilum]